MLLQVVLGWWDALLSEVLWSADPRPGSSQEQVAEALRQETIRSGGWAVDAGILPVSAFEGPAAGPVARVTPRARPGRPQSVTIGAGPSHSG
jgi:hypothetical protein